MKMPKATQDTRIDLPAIGPHTIEKLRSVGLKGVAVAANGVVIIDRPTVVKVADAFGIFVTGEVTSSQAGPPLNVAIVVGEHSGDQLGFKLMRALRTAAGGPARSLHGRRRRSHGSGGVGKHIPAARHFGHRHLPVLARLPPSLRAFGDDRFDRGEPAGCPRHHRQSGFHAPRRAWRPRSLPGLPLSTMSAPASGHGGRAGRRRCGLCRPCAGIAAVRACRTQRLGGPPCTYVGHPLIERLDMLRPWPVEAGRRDGGTPVLVVLPGSRRVEVTRSDEAFGETCTACRRRHEFEAVIPAVSHLAAGSAWQRGHGPFAFGSWKEKARSRIFRAARAALAHPARSRWNWRCQASRWSSATGFDDRGSADSWLRSLDRSAQSGAWRERRS